MLNTFSCTCWPFEYLLWKKRLFRSTTFFFFFFLAMPCSGILVPRPGIKPTPPALEAWSLNHWTAREAPIYPSLNWIWRGFLLLNCVSCLHFGYRPLTGYVVCDYFLPFHRLPFYFVDYFFYCAEFF